MNGDEVYRFAAVTAAISLAFGLVGTFLGLHAYRFYMNQFLGMCTQTSAECMVPLIG